MYRTTFTLIAAAAVTLSACGDDADAAIRDGMLAVEMADFHYDGLPDEVPAGTRLTVANTSEQELHELVAFRLDDSDDRDVADIVGDDLGALLGSAEPAAVLLAAPGGPQIAAVGDGTLTEPGRYVLLCVVPTGADPAAYLEAAATSDGPPQVDGGPPHVTQGMYAELTVTS
jgi:hypothetical protein